MTETNHQAIGTVRPQDVAKKLAAIRNHEYPELRAQLTSRPRLAEVMWFLQYMSMQPGGLLKFATDMYEGLPGHFGTETMRASKRQEYTLEEKERILGEIALDYNPVYYCSQGELEAVFRIPRDYPDPWSAEALAQEQRELQLSLQERREREQRLKSLTGQQLREICRKAALEILPRFFEDICIQCDKGFIRPSLDTPKRLAGPYWFMDDPVAAVVDMMDRRAQEVSKRLAMTTVTRKVFDALDYALQEQVMVQIEGDSRLGKTESIKAWADMRPGLVRIVEVPSSNTLDGLLRRICDAHGITYTCGTRAQVLTEQIEYVLRESHMFLILDEAAFLIPQNYTQITAPARLNWRIFGDFSGWVGAEREKAFRVTAIGTA
jgi:hypothetical protein